VRIHSPMLRILALPPKNLNNATRLPLVQAPLRPTPGRTLRRQGAKAPTTGHSSPRNMGRNICRSIPCFRRKCIVWSTPAVGPCQGRSLASATAAVACSKSSRISTALQGLKPWHSAACAALKTLPRSAMVPSLRSRAPTATASIVRNPDTPSSPIRESACSWPGQTFPT